MFSLSLLSKELLLSLNPELENDGLKFGMVLKVPKSAIKMIEKINNGKRIIPTILVDDKVYVNPGISELMKIISK